MFIYIYMCTSAKAAQCLTLSLIQDLGGQHHLLQAKTVCGQLIEVGS